MSQVQDFKINLFSDMDESSEDVEPDRDHTDNNMMGRVVKLNDVMGTYTYLS